MAVSGEAAGNGPAAMAVHGVTGEPLNQHWARS